MRAGMLVAIEGKSEVAIGNCFIRKFKSRE
jgi:hypothetical protein